MIERYELIEDILRAFICIGATRVLRKVFVQRYLAQKGSKDRFLRMDGMEHMRVG
jgi:hypothetical protein